MSQLRKIQRSVQRKEDEENNEEIIPVDHKKLPVGKVLSDPVRGEHLTIPLFGWVALRAQEATPLVMLVVVLLDPETKDTKGTLQIEFPIFTETEDSTLSVLEGYGWDGRLWPTDEGWPTGDEVEETQLKELLRQANLKATFVFPPGSSGYSAQMVNITRARGPFLMPPLLDPDSKPSQERLERFRQVVTNPKLFL